MSDYKTLKKQHLMKNCNHQVIDLSTDECEICGANTYERLYWSPKTFSFGSQESVSNPDVCMHKWKPYVGLTESYEFCEVCDEKK